MIALSKLPPWEKSKSAEEIPGQTRESLSPGLTWNFLRRLGFLGFLPVHPRPRKERILYSSESGHNTGNMTLQNSREIRVVEPINACRRVYPRSVIDREKAIAFQAPIRHQ